MDRCQCCGRPFKASKLKLDKKLAEDIAKAQSAISKLENYQYDEIDTPIARTALQVAILEELARLTRCINGDYRLLWSIYRRRDKASGYQISAVPDQLKEVA